MTKREVRSDPTEEPEPELARTVALPIMDLAGDDLDRAMTEAHVCDRPQPSIPPVVGRPGRVRDATSSRPQPVPQPLGATADLPRLTQVGSDSNVSSAPSVRTEHLVAIRRRRYGAVAALLLGTTEEGSTSPTCDIIVSQVG